jgi:copper transport protein
LAVAVVATSVSGHASALSPQAFYVANSALHLAAVGAWVGGLLMLAAAGRAWFDLPSSDTLVRRFSTVALVAVPVMVITGVVQAAALIGGFDDLTASAWGRILLVKVTLVLVLVVLGGVGRWLLQHDGPSSLRRGVMVEAAIGLVVIALTAGLVGEPPRVESLGQVFSTTIPSGGVIADVTVTPGRVGVNELHLVFTPPGGNLDPVLDAQARMSLPSAGIPNSPVTMLQEGTNHYSGTITLPEPGAWTLEIIVTVAPASTVLLSTTVDIPG